MTSTTSCRKGFHEFLRTFAWSLKKRTGIIVLFSLLELITLPVIIILVLIVQISEAEVSSYFIQSDPAVLAENLARVFTSSISLLVPVLIVPLSLLLALIIAVILYRYMHQKRSVDLFHSLPIGRIPLLSAQYLTGICTILIPLLISFGVTMLLIPIFQLELDSAIIGDIAAKFGWAAFLAIAAFTFSTLMAVCSGTTFDMVISTVVINISYPITVFLVTTMITCILPGLSGLSPSALVLTAFSPFIAAFIPYTWNLFGGSVSTSFFDINFIAWWIALTLVMLAASLFLYYKRKSECAESHYAFAIPKNIIRFIATAACGLGLGFILNLVAGTGTILFLVGVLFGSIAAHLIAEAIYSRGFSQFKKSLIPYAVFLVIFGVGFTGLSTGWFGTDTYIPDAEDVQSVEISDGRSYYNYEDTGFCWPANLAHGENAIYNPLQQKIGELNTAMTERDLIDAARSYHSSIIQMYRTQFPYTMHFSTGSAYQITYHMKDGHVVTRSYYYPIDSEITVGPFAETLTDPSDYIRQQSILFYIEPSDILDVNVYDDNNSLFWESESQKAALLQAMQKDALETPFIHYDNASNSIAVSLNFGEFDPQPGSAIQQAVGDYTGMVTLDSTTFTINPQMKHTYQLLMENGWLYDSSSETAMTNVPVAETAMS